MKPGSIRKGISSTTKDMQLNVHHLLEHAAQAHKDQEVVTYRPNSVHRYTYEDMHDRAKQAANALEDMGVQAGDLVGIGTHSTHEAIELLYATASIGASPHFLNPESEQHSHYLVNHITKHGPMDYVFLHNDMADRPGELLPNPDEYSYVTYGEEERVAVDAGEYLGDYEDLLEDAEDEYEWPRIDEDTAVVMTSSGGTTGTPKAIAQSHRAAWLIGHGIARSHKLGPQSGILMFPPLHHGVGWFLWATAPIAGAKLVLPGPDTPANFQEIVLEEDITYTAGVAPLVRQLVDTIETRNEEGEDIDLEGTWFLFGGENTPTKLLRDLDDLGATSLQMYGGAETQLYFVQNIQVDPRLREAEMSQEEFLEYRSTTVGYPVPGAKIKAVDTDGNEVPRDGETIGRACVTAPWVSGYWHRPDKTAATDVDGYINLDDLITIDEYGNVKYRDRAQDAIEKDREMIPTPSVEDALSENEFVSTVAVIGVPHPEHGEESVAVVETAEGTSADDVDIDLEAALQDAVKSGKIQESWIPDQVIILDELPRAHSGKMDKVALREEYNDLYQ
jgi:fatty-acyl-CoA synthase